MLNRLGHITAELSSALLKSIFIPGHWLRRLTRREGERPRGGKSAVRELRTPAAAPTGVMVLVGGSSIPDAAVVAALHHAGGRGVAVLVLPVGEASELAAAEAIRNFQRFGVRRVDALEPIDRQRAAGAHWPERVIAADVLVLVGSDRERVVATLKDTPLHQALRQASDAGRVLVAAGEAAPALAEQMLGQGSAVSEGLGLLPRLLLAAPFDTHRRFSDLVQAVGGQPGVLLGGGIAPGAGLVIKAGEAQVVGEAGVTIVDARDCAEPEDALSDPEILPGDASACCGLKVHLLVEGYGLNLKTRRPLGPGRDPARTEAAGS